MSTPSSWSRASVHTGMLALCFLGLLVSWGFFLQWMGHNGVDFFGFWRAANLNGASVGLNVDLTTCGLVLTAVLFQQRRLLPRHSWWVGVLVIWVLGVCGGAGVLLWGLRARSAQ